MATYAWREKRPERHLELCAESYRRRKGPAVAARKAERAAAAKVRAKARRSEHEKRPHVAAYRAAYKARPERLERMRELRARPEARARRAEAARLRRARDPAFALRMRMSCLVRAALRTGKAGRPWVSLVPYTLQDLRLYLERQFLQGMGWHNMREWHIDHVVPLSSFDMTDGEQFRTAWGLPNLRPIWAADNIRKGSRRLLLC